MLSWWGKKSTKSKNDKQNQQQQLFHQSSQKNRMVRRLSLIQNHEEKIGKHRPVKSFDEVSFNLFLHNSLQGSKEFSANESSRFSGFGPEPTYPQPVIHQSSQKNPQSFIQPLVQTHEEKIGKHKLVRSFDKVSAKPFSSNSPRSSNDFSANSSPQFPSFDPEGAYPQPLPLPPASSPSPGNAQVVGFQSGYVSVSSTSSSFSLSDDYTHVDQGQLSPGSHSRSGSPLQISLVHVFTILILRCSLFRSRFESG